MMRIVLTINADELKLLQLLSKFSETRRMVYRLTRKNGGFLMQVETDDFGELVRRLNHLKDCSFQIVEVHGGGLIEKLNVKTTRTNIDALIGKVAAAKTDIDPLEGGVIKLFGEIWHCRPANEKIIKEGTKVTVVGAEGVSLIVTEVK